jgi:transcriptional regulator with XRE-family HTH domain
VQLTPSRPAAFNAQGMRAQRERVGLTLCELHGLTGIPRPELQAYESGTVQPQPHRVVTLAGAFGVRPLALMNQDVIGCGLASLRVTAGLCRQELATRAGISVLLLRGLESGTTCQLDWATARRIARALRTSPEAVRRAHHRDVNRGRIQE